MHVPWSIDQTNTYPDVLCADIKRVSITSVLETSLWLSWYCQKVCQSTQRQLHRLWISHTCITSSIIRVASICSDRWAAVQCSPMNVETRYHYLANHLSVLKTQSLPNQHRSWRIWPDKENIVRRLLQEYTPGMCDQLHLFVLHHPSV